MESGPTDPNEKHDDELARGKDHRPLSEADAWGTKLNPVRDTPVPFGGLSDGGSKTG
jgi:hypothetical protein